jgi:hypothetical protein
MMNISTSVPIQDEEERTEENGVSEGHLQLIKYRIQTGFYNEEAIKKPLADSIIEHAKWFQNATENNQS